MCRYIFAIILLAMRAPTMLYASQAKVLTKNQVRKIDEELHSAVLKKELKIVQKLLEKGASPDAQIDHYGTILMHHVRSQCINDIRNSEFPDCDCLPILEALLKKCSDINKKNKREETALSQAIIRRKGTVVRAHMLIKAGADINAILNASGDTALVRAITHEDPKIIRFLIQKGALFDGETDPIFTPLCSAAIGVNNSCACVVTLLNAGALANSWFYKITKKQDPELLENLEVQEALKHCEDRRLGYQNAIARTVYETTGTVILDIANIIATYAISAAPPRVPSEAEMKIIQPFLNEIERYKQCNCHFVQGIIVTLENIIAGTRYAFPTFSIDKNFDDQTITMFDQLSHLTLNSIQREWLEDAVENCKLHIYEELLNQERSKREANSKCLVM